MLQMKTTSKGRPQNVQSGISHVIESYSNFKLKLQWPNHILQILEIKMTSNERWPQNIKSGLVSS